MTDQREEFLSGLAHAVKGPVHNALGFAELLRMGRYGEISEKQQEAVARIEALTEDATGQLEILFEFLEVMVEAQGNSAGQEEPADVRSCLRTAVREARRAATAPPPRFDLHIAPDCSPVAGTPPRLRFLFSLLVGRALELAPPGVPVSVLAGDGASHRPSDEVPEAVSVPVTVATGNGAIPSADGNGPSGSGGGEGRGDDACEIIARYLVRQHGGEVEFTYGADGFRALCRLPAHDAP